MSEMMKHCHGITWQLGGIIVGKWIPRQQFSPFGQRRTARPMPGERARAYIAPAIVLTGSKSRPSISRAPLARIVTAW